MVNSPDLIKFSHHKEPNWKDNSQEEHKRDHHLNKVKETITTTLS